ncbi:MAG: hypothetical protein ACK5QC_09245 [Bacteroidota bacterium]|jgi:hypothetical protein|nr:hypothetical protein [Bacteroidota bacterium]MCA6443374.1 hypothetical protein [Bacteroidota bacterium]
MNKRLTTIITLILLKFFAYGQSCGSCNISINSLDSSSYTINQGQTLCLDSNAVFVGTITINGGVVCNKGLLSPKQLAFHTGGTLYNYSNISLSGSFSLGNNCVLEVKDGSTFNISNGVFNINGGQVTNDGVITVIGAINFNAGIFNSSNLINCNTLSGTASIVNSGVINKQ